MPVRATRSVRRTAGMITLPAPDPEIAGVLPGKPPLTVISSLGGGGTHVLVVDTGDKTFGLLVDVVTGLRHISDSDITPAPAGQHRPLVCGTIHTGDHLVLVTDPDALGAGL
jgi:chemotaxis signal transduction protein